MVSNGLDVQSAAGECALTEGDVLQMTAPAAPNSAMADLAVMASKGQDCRKGTVVSVAVADLQDMQNHMRETLDQGLADLPVRQGKDGLPSLPTGARLPRCSQPMLPPRRRPIPTSPAKSPSRPNRPTRPRTMCCAGAVRTRRGGAPTSVTLGMTIDQVVGILGQPQASADLGQKKIYTYGSMKVIFMDGKVYDVQ